MPQTHLPVVCHGAGDAEGLEADADGGGGVCGGLDALLHGDGGAHGVGPAGVLKADGLDALDDLVGVEAQIVADGAAFLDGTDAVFGQNAVDFVDTSFVAFKQCHSRSPYSFLGSMYWAASANWP